MPIPSPSTRAHRELGGPGCAIRNRQRTRARLRWQVMAIDRSGTSDRLARIENVIEEYRALKQRRLLRLAVRLWRRAEARQRLAALETPLERVH